MSSRSALLVLSATITLFAVRPAAAAWPHDPTTNVKLSNGFAYAEIAPTSVPDGAGGAIVAWTDTRYGDYDIVAQRVSAAGVPLWTAGGVAVTALPGSNQTFPVAVSDGAGGVIIAWADFRNAGVSQVYAQHLNASGAVVGGWPANGLRLTNVGVTDFNIDITTDGAGGALVSYERYWNLNDHDPDVIRVTSAGTVPIGWSPGSGVALCTLVSAQQLPRICSDGSGGAIVTWQDKRSGAFDIYAGKVTSAGTIPWTTDGVVLCSAPGDQTQPLLVGDGSGGAIVAWNDYRSGTNYDVYAEHVTAAGNLSNGWPSANQAMAVLTSGSDDWVNTLVTDGSGGAIAAGAYIFGFAVEAQRISGSGLALWGSVYSGGLLLNSGATGHYAVACSDNAGGAVIAWEFSAGSPTDLVAERVTGSGSLAAGWGGNGVPVATATGSQYSGSITSDGASGAIVSFLDLRDRPDVYAQRIERFGQLGNPEPAISKVKDVPNDQGGHVKLTWSASYLDNDPQFAINNYWIWRSVPGSVAAAALSRGGRLVTEEDGAVIASPRRGTRLFKTTVTNGASYAWEYVGSQVAQAFPSYSVVVATSSDSTFGSNPFTAFMVEAKPSSNAYWNSSPDSGYSVDNLPPATPAPFTGQWVRAAGTAMQWGANHEPDLAGYLLYRGSSAGFAPGPGNLVASLTGTSYTDPAGTQFSFFKLAAVDAHGNVSGYALLAPSGTVDVPAAELPREVGLLALGANPVHGDLALRFGLPRDGVVTIAIYDAAGRRVRDLVKGSWPAGYHDIRWDGRDEAGRGSASGLYLARLEAEGRVIVRRFLALR